MTPLFAGGITKITDTESLKASSGDLPAGLEKEHKETIEDHAFPRHSFGGPCMSAVWNMSYTWWMRQHEKLALLVGKILGADDSKCSLDRCSVKMPGKGDYEWIHKEHNENLQKSTKAEIAGTYCVT